MKDCLIECQVYGEQCPGTTKIRFLLHTNSSKSTHPKFLRKKEVLKRGFKKRFCYLFLGPRHSTGGHILVSLSICLSVCLFAILHWNHSLFLRKSFYLSYLKTVKNERSYCYLFSSPNFISAKFYICSWVIAQDTPAQSDCRILLSAIIQERIKWFFFISYMWLDIYGSYKLILSFQLRVAKYTWACPKCEYRTNHQYLRKELSDCVNFLNSAGHQ